MESTSERKRICGECFVETVIARQYGSSSSFPEGYLSEMSGLFGLQSPLKLALLSWIWELCRDSEDKSVRFGKVHRMEFSERMKCRLQTVNNMLGSLVSTGLIERSSRSTFSVREDLFPGSEVLDEGGLVLRLCIEYRINRR